MGGLFGGGGGSGDNGAAQRQLDLQEKQMKEQEARLEQQEAEAASKLQAQMKAKRRGARALLSQERDDELGISDSTLG